MRLAPIIRRRRAEMHFGFQDSRRSSVRRWSGQRLRIHRGNRHVGVGERVAVVLRRPWDSSSSIGSTIIIVKALSD